MNTAADRVVKHRLSVADYHRMGEAGLFAPGARVELIDGEIYGTPPIGSPHASIVDRLTETLVAAAIGRAIVRVQNPITLGERSEPEPDLSLLRRRDDFYADSHPRAEDVLLVIEVAESSLRHDRGVKLALYARHAIPEFWLIDVANRTVTTFGDPSGESYRNVSTPSALDELRPTAIADVTLDLSTLF